MLPKTHQELLDMNFRNGILALSVGLVLAAPHLAVAQVPVTAAADHTALLASADPRLAQNKRLVYDFWREVFEAAQMDRVGNYLAEGYIQHNPTVATGRAAFVEFFSRIRQPKPIEAKVSAPLVAITAEGDLVILSFVREVSEPKDPSVKYTTTWFDMFRIEDGKIAEHWDPAMKR
jgi:predicted SnoaL-like aldol condensation-catalyzing enzyme